MSLKKFLESICDAFGRLFVGGLFVCIILFVVMSVVAQPATNHVVRSGDTLWGISEGDPGACRLLYNSPFRPKGVKFYPDRIWPGDIFLCGVDTATSSTPNSEILKAFRHELELAKKELHLLRLGLHQNNARLEKVKVVSLTTLLVIVVVLLCGVSLILIRALQQQDGWLLPGFPENPEGTPIPEEHEKEEPPTESEEPAGTPPPPAEDEVNPPLDRVKWGLWLDPLPVVVSVSPTPASGPVAPSPDEKLSTGAASAHGSEGSGTKAFISFPLSKGPTLIHKRRGDQGRRFTNFSATSGGGASPPAQPPATPPKGGAPRASAGLQSDGSFAGRSARRIGRAPWWRRLVPRPVAEFFGLPLVREGRLKSLTNPHIRP